MSDENNGEAAARDQALRWLARREYSQRELSRRLQSKGFDAKDIAPVLAGLGEDGYQSDERFAEVYIRSRRERGFGPERVAAELGERGIARDLVSSLLDRDDPDWGERAVAELDKRFPEDGGRPDVRQRQQFERFLRYRGFSASQIRRALEHRVINHQVTES